MDETATPLRSATGGHRPSRRSAGALAAAIVVALGLSACGSSSPPSGTAADPATVVPASASVYVSAVARPEGALRHDTLAAAKALTGTKEPFGAIVDALASAGGLPHIDYTREVKPWLGPNAGLFVGSTAGIAGLVQGLGASLGEGSISTQSLLQALEKGLSGKQVDVALVLDTSDLASAKSFVAKLAKKEGAHEASFDGSHYELASGGTALGIVGKFAVLGSEAGMRGVIETRAGSSALASADAYTKLAAKAKSSSTLLSAYVNDEAVAKAAASEGDAGLLGLLPGEPQQLMLSLHPEAGVLTVDADLLASSSAASSSATSSSEAASALVGELPGSSWLALGAGEVGKHIGAYFTTLGGVVSIAGKSLLAGLGGPALEGLFKKLASNQSALRRIFSGWAQAGGVFVAGNGLLDLQAGLVLSSSTAAGPKAAVAKLGQALKAAGAQVSSTTIAGAEAALEVRLTGLPLVVDVGSGQKRLVIGLGPSSVQAALSPEGGTLSQSSFYAMGAAALGGTKPALILDFPTLVSFLEGLSLTESPSISGVMPALRSLGTLVGGWQQLSDGVTRLKLVLPLSG